MMLERQPTTEFEYWQALEDCDRTVLRLADGLRRGLVPKKEREDTRRALQKANQMSAALIKDIERKFNVFCRKNHPTGTVKPKGMEDMLDWWNRMDKMAQGRAKVKA